MGALAKEELASAAGTTPDQIDRLVAVGVLETAGDGSFGSTDIQRVRLAEAFERSGISLDSIGKAIESGHLSFAFVDLVFPEPVPYTSKTYAQTCAETGLSRNLVELIHESVGLPRPEISGRVREDDEAMFPMAQLALSMGMSEPEIARVLGVYGENLRRLTQAETHFYHSYVEEPLMRSGMPEQQMRDIASQMNPQLLALVQRLLMWLYRRHQEHFITAHLVEHVEAALEEIGVAPPRPATPPAIVFLDLVGYTRLTEERGDEAAAELAANLGRLVQRTARGYGGDPVKWLGDGVMFHFPRAADAVVSALDMVEQTPTAGLPAAHVGVNAGSVIFRDGDYYGRTVNIASRIAGHAGPDEVLVSQEVVEAVGPCDIRFEELGPVELKNVPRPVVLHRAARG